MVNSSISKFFDFYAMYELYMRVGGFREEGYPGYDVFVNEPIYRRIVDKYEQVVDDFYKEIFEALELSVAGEIDHFPQRCPECKAPNEPQFYDKLCRKAGITRKQIQDCKDDVVTYAEVVYALFSVPKWSAQYGGKKWAKAAMLLIESKSLKTRHDKVMWCDRVLDLHHNTGHLLNKTDFAPLSTDYLPGSGRYKALNFRAKARSVMQFVPYLSPSVRNLVIPRARLLDNACQV